VPQSTIAPKIHKALDIHGNFPSEVPFHFVSGHFCPKFFCLGFVQILDFGFAIDTRTVADLLRGGAADSIYGCQADLNMFIVWKIYSSNTCHFLISVLITPVQKPVRTRAMPGQKGPDSTKNGRTHQFRKASHGHN
jgi:hypothetical protein